MPITFQNVTITGGVQLLSAGAVPPSGDPYWANVSLLMNNTTSNNQTNNVFLDSSTNNFTVTRLGTPTQGSFTPYTVAPNTSYSTSVNGGSGYFDGSGDILSISSAPNVAVGTSPFTLEGWCYFNDVNTSGAGFGSCASFTDVESARGVSLFLTGSGGWRFRIGRSVAGQFEDFLGTTTLVANLWYHFKIVRTSTGTNDTRVFLNGVQEAIGTSTININYQRFSVGRYLPNDAQTTNLLNGYVCDVRLTNNAQPSTVPTSPLTAVSGTQVLLNFTNAGIYDAATKNNLITLANSKVSTVQSKFAPTSVFFDGSSVIDIPINTALQFVSGDFTMEGWIYPTSSGANQLIVTQDDGTSSSQTFQWNLGATNTLVFTYFTSASRSSAITRATSNTVSTNSWSHVAVTRSGNTLRMFINGTQGYSGTDSTMFQGTNVTTLAGFKSGAYTAKFSGYMQDLRITKGIARYTSNFTAPTSSFPTY